MNREYRLINGNKYKWPVSLKVGIFRADKTGKFRISLRFKPLFLFHVFIPGKIKIWISIEKNVISTMYAGFLKMPRKSN